MDRPPALEPADDEEGLSALGSPFGPEDAETTARLDAEAEADFAAGRVVSHEAVKAWLLSWGTDNELPRPQWGALPRPT